MSSPWGDATAGAFLFLPHHILDSAVRHRSASHAPPTAFPHAIHVHNPHPRRSRRQPARQGRRFHRRSTPPRAPRPTSEFGLDRRQEAAPALIKDTAGRPLVGAESPSATRPAGPAAPAVPGCRAGGAGRRCNRLLPLVGRSRRAPGTPVGAESLRRPRPAGPAVPGGADRRCNRLLPSVGKARRAPGTPVGAESLRRFRPERAGRASGAGLPRLAARIAGETGSYPRLGKRGVLPEPR